jgi:hypothetical protein
MTLQELNELAEKSWEGCDGCDENDKYFFIKGFQTGYNRATPDEISGQEIEKASQETYPVKKKDFMYIPTYGVINLEDSDERFDINQRLKQIGFIAGIKWYKEQIKQRE